jgi:GTPase
MKKNFPIVSVVGRKNVGKSTLFNRLTSETRAIVFDREGVTRDFLAEDITWNRTTFTLVDTGGLSFERHPDPLSKLVYARARECIQESDLIIFVVDASMPLQDEDERIAKELRKTGKHIILILNKSDRRSSQEYGQEIIFRFGFKHHLFFSAAHARGISTLLEKIQELLPEKTKQLTLEEEDACKVVLLGKPNVGKSSLLNMLLGKDRAIVSDVPGTTREAIVEKMKWYQGEIQIIDTAGVRRKRSVTEDLEQAMVANTLQVVKDANIVLLLVDAHEAILSDQEIKLAYYVFQNQRKGLIILLNKQDLMTEELKKQLSYDMEQYEQILDKVVLLPISCLTGKNIGRILPTVKEVWDRYSQTFDDEQLFSVLLTALEKKPLFKSQNKLLLYKVKQLQTAPITLLLTVNEPLWFDDSHNNFFENMLRKKFDLRGVPIIFRYAKR